MGTCWGPYCTHIISMEFSYSGNKCSSKISPRHRRSEEASSIQAKNRCVVRDKEVPEEHGVVDKEASIPKAGERLLKISRLISGSKAALSHLSKRCLRLGGVV
ncbi:hypothetical protein ACFE04_015063 [Oxalis oulophora]